MSEQRTTVASALASVNADSHRVLGNNTVEYTHAGVRFIRLHFTDVLIFYPDGSFRVNSGGWRTATTRARIRQYLPAPWGLKSIAGVWFLVNPVGALYPFEDGLTVKDGKVYDVSGNVKLATLKARKLC